MFQFKYCEVHKTNYTTYCSLYAGARVKKLKSAQLDFSSKQALREEFAAKRKLRKY